MSDILCDGQKRSFVKVGASFRTCRKLFLQSRISWRGFDERHLAEDFLRNKSDRSCVEEVLIINLQEPEVPPLSEKTNRTEVPMTTRKVTSSSEEKTSDSSALPNNVVKQALQSLWIGKTS